MGLPHHSNGALLVVLAAILWGTTGTAQAFAPVGASPLSVGALRILVGGIGLFTLALLRGDFRRWFNWHPLTTAIAALSTAAYQLAFFGAVRQTGVAVGTMVAIGSAPLFAGLLGWAFQREPLTGRWWAATVAAVVGCVLLVGAGSALQVNAAGVLLALGAGGSYAVFTLANKRLLAHHTALEVMAVSFCLGALLLLPILLTVGASWAASGRGILVVLHLGLVATTLSYALFGAGLRTTPVATAATLSLAEPLTAALLGVFLLSESVGGRGVLGMALIFAGLAILAIRRRPVVPAGSSGDNSVGSPS